MITFGCSQNIHERSDQYSLAVFAVRKRSSTEGISNTWINISVLTKKMLLKITEKAMRSTGAGRKRYMISSTRTGTACSEFAKHQYDELAAMALAHGEEEQLEEDISYLNNYENPWYPAVAYADSACFRIRRRPRL